MKRGRLTKAEIVEAVIAGSLGFFAIWAVIFLLILLLGD